MYVVWCFAQSQILSLDMPHVWCVGASTFKICLGRWECL